MIMGFLRDFLLENDLCEFIVLHAVVTTVLVIRATARISASSRSPTKTERLVYQNQCDE
ncbi:hypothetical protein Bca4012_077523 [Brassica carinata]